MPKISIIENTHSQSPITLEMLESATGLDLADSKTNIPEEDRELFSLCSRQATQRLLEKYSVHLSPTQIQQLKSNSDNPIIMTQTDYATVLKSNQNSKNPTNFPLYNYDAFVDSEAGEDWAVLNTAQQQIHFLDQIEKNLTPEQKIQWEPQLAHLHEAANTYYAAEILPENHTKDTLMYDQITNYSFWQALEDELGQDNIRQFFFQGQATIDLNEIIEAARKTWSEAATPIETASDFLSQLDKNDTTSSVRSQ